MEALALLSKNQNGCGANFKPSPAGLLGRYSSNRSSNRSHVEVCVRPVCLLRWKRAVTFFNRNREISSRIRDDEPQTYMELKYEPG